MKVDRNKVKKISLSIIIISGFVTAFELSVFAQSPRTISPIDRRVELINRQSEQFERDKMNRELNGKNRNAANLKRNQAIKAQIKEDFEAIQSAYNKIVVNLQSGGNIDREFVVETTTDIKKYADRLKDNLALPEPEKDTAKEAQAKEELNLDNRRKSLLMLCQHIYNFVTNPIFNEPTGLDVDQAAKAGREMDKIIQLSVKIKETAEKISN
jgi:hypothetical protein